MAKNYEMAILIDFYGEMLTAKQRDFLEYYYNDDLSLSEIAENEGITRQGVRDAIKRAETQLQDMENRLGKSVNLNIVEVRSPDLNAQLVAENIAQQLEKRISHRRAMKNSMARAMRAGAKGIKVCCSGRLGGRVWAALRSPAPSPTTRAPSPCRPSALTSSMASLRLLPPSAASA